MAELIQFPCPACGTTLRLPLEWAGRQGPCPNCDREIVAPDPHLGQGAWVVPLPPPPPEIEPFRAYEHRRESAPPPHEEPQAAVSSPAPPDLPQRAILVLSCLLTGSVALAVGFALGVKSNRSFTEIPPMPELVIPPEPAPPPVPPTVDPVPVPEEKPEPEKISSAAEAALRAFLEAPDWAARSAYVLEPGKVGPMMEAYSREMPDGPTEFLSIRVKQSHLDPDSGETTFIFMVATTDHPAGIPVAVKETAVGWLVDWPAFIEFRDGLFQKFTAGPADQPGRFHLLVTAPPPEKASETENEHFSSYFLQSPVSEKARMAFVRKDTEAAATLDQATRDGALFTPVLEVVKRVTGEGRDYLEITGVVATDWLPR